MAVVNQWSSQSTNPSFLSSGQNGVIVAKFSDKTLHVVAVIDPSAMEALQVVD